MTKQRDYNWQERHPNYCKKWRKKNLKYCTQISHQLKINGCAICGYNKCDAALDFHHSNPEDKKYSITKNNLSKKDIVEELNKCILLCCRCHKEIEND